MSNKNVVTTNRDGLKDLFGCKLEEWRKEKGDELIGALLEWGSAVPMQPENTLWDALKLQIDYLAQKHGISEEKVVGGLFAQKNADAFMCFLQI